MAKFKEEQPSLFRLLDRDRTLFGLKSNAQGNYIEIQDGATRLAKIAKVFHKMYSRSIFVDLNMALGTRAYVFEGDIYLSVEALYRPEVYMPVVIHEIVHAKISNKNLANQYKTHWGLQFRSNRTDGLGSFYGSYFRLDEILAFYKGALSAKKSAEKKWWFSLDRRLLKRELESQKLHGASIVVAAKQLLQLLSNKIKDGEIDITSINADSVEILLRKGDLDLGSISVTLPFHTDMQLPLSSEQNEILKAKIVDLVNAANFDVKFWGQKFGRL